MVKIIQLGTTIIVGEGDIEVQTDDCNAVGVVGKIEDDESVYFKMGTRDGVQFYGITKKFAKKLGEALLEIAK